MRLAPIVEHKFDVLFLDTEFTRLPRAGECADAWRSSINVLSVALVPLNDEASFYGIRHPIHRGVTFGCTEFVERHVLPVIHAAPATHHFNTRERLQEAVQSYLRARREKTGRPALVAADWPGDTVLVEAALPDDAQCAVLPELQPLMGGAPYWAMPGRYRHNALHDAQALRELYLARSREGREV